MIDRRAFLATVAGGVAASAVAARAGQSRADGTTSSSGPLADPAFRPLPVGAIRPAGWLERQLRIQADGLSGHLDQFWPDVGQSQWFGDRKSTRLNSSHQIISYAVFCLKKKNSVLPCS